MCDWVAWPWDNSRTGGGEETGTRVSSSHRLAKSVWQGLPPLPSDEIRCNKVNKVWSTLTSIDSFVALNGKKVDFLSSFQQQMIAGHYILSDLQNTTHADTSKETNQTILWHSIHLLTYYKGYTHNTTPHTGSRFTILIELDTAASSISTSFA